MLHVLASNTPVIFARPTRRYAVAAPSLRVASLLLVALSLPRSEAVAQPQVEQQREQVQRKRLEIQAAAREQLLVRQLGGEVTNASTSVATTLYWKNRDQLTGELVSADDKEIRWQSPLFSEPLRIDVRHLQRIRRPTHHRVAPSEPFRFIMRNSDIFYADLVDITADAVLIKSRAHGESRLQRSAMLSFHRIDARNAATKRLSDGNSRVYMLNGSFLNGKITGINEARQIVLSNSRQPGVRIDLDRVASVYFFNDGRSVALNYQLQIACIDGTRLRGQLVSVDNEAVTMKMSWGDQPFRCRLEQIYEMRFLSRETPESNAPDSLLLKSGKLHGELSTTEDGQLAWKVVGGSSATPLAAGVEARIDRQPDLTAQPPAPPAAGDVLYLTSGDVLPCRIVTIDEELVQVETEISDVSSVARSQVKAVGFSTDAPLRGAGPGVGRWNLQAQDDDAIEIEGEHVIFHGRGSVSRAGIFPCDELQFDVKWTASQPLVMTVSMGTPDAAQRQGSPLLLAYFVGSDMLVRGLQGRLQQAVVQRNRAKGSQARVRIIFGEKDIQVFVDGARRLTQPQQGNQLAARSILFTMQQAGRQQAAKTKQLLTLTGFRVTRTGGPCRALRVDEDIKEFLLTVPRFQSESPPQHLLVARNGDLLRGQLVDVTPERVRFTSRLRDLALTRQRLLGIIWLDPEPTEEAPRPPHPENLRVLLTSGAAVSLASPRFDKQRLTGKSVLLGEYSIPLTSIRALEIGGWQSAEDTSVESPWQLQSAKEPNYIAFGNQDASGPGTLDDMGMHSPLVGTTVEDLQLWLMDGTNFRIDQHDDKIVLLEFWASWCGPCVRSMPETIEAVRTFGNDDVMLVAVNQQEPLDVVRQFIEARQLDVTVALDRDGRVGQQFGIDAIPQLIIIGKGGKIERVFVGANPGLAERLKTVLEELTAEDAAEAGS